MTVRAAAADRRAGAVALGLGALSMACVLGHQVGHVGVESDPTASGGASSEVTASSEDASMSDTLSDTQATQDTTATGEVDGGTSTGNAVTSESTSGLEITTSEGSDTSSTEGSGTSDTGGSGGSESGSSGG